MRPAVRRLTRSQLAERARRLRRDLSSAASRTEAQARRLEREGRHGEAEGFRSSLVGIAAAAERVDELFPAERLD